MIGVETEEVMLESNMQLCAHAQFGGEIVLQGALGLAGEYTSACAKD